MWTRHRREVMPDSRDITQQSRYSRPGTQCPSPATHDTPGVRARQALDISSPIYPCIRAAILAADPACNRRRAAACAFAAGESMNVPRRLQPLEFGKLRCATPRRSVHLHARAARYPRGHDTGNAHCFELQALRRNVILRAAREWLRNAGRQRSASYARSRSREYHHCWP